MSEAKNGVRPWVPMGRMPPYWADLYLEAEMMGSHPPSLPRLSELLEESNQRVRKKIESEKRLEAVRLWLCQEDD